jgi:hypothetical protein
MPQGLQNQHLERARQQRFYHRDPMPRLSMYWRAESSETSGS